MVGFRAAWKSNIRGRLRNLGDTRQRNVCDFTRSVMRAIIIEARDVDSVREATSTNQLTCCAALADAGCTTDADIVNCVYAKYLRQ